MTSDRKLLRILELESRAGRRALDALLRRGDEILDRRRLRATAKIVDGVHRKGDPALLGFVRELDGVDVPAVAALRVAPEARVPVAPDVAVAIDVAIEAAERYHRAQVHPGFKVEIDGAILEERRAPLARAGLYVPGGRASYPSTAILTAVPARCAGVQEIVMATPLAAWNGSPALRYAAQRLGIGEIWGIGGAPAIAALAYGTASIRRVDCICGPGNAWVTAAKKLVAGDVRIDMLAGPTEVLILAGEDADADLVAADLLAQAEHDPLAAPVLVTTSARLAKAVRAALAAQLPLLATRETATASLVGQGTCFLVADAEAALRVAEELAPEHLQVVGTAMEALAPRLTRAGAIFVGAASGEVFGDYVAGPSHVLPTGGTARFASSLGVEDFVRRSHAITLSREAATRLAPHAAALAFAEGFPAHAQAALRRLP